MSGEDIGIERSYPVLLEGGYIVCEMSPDITTLHVYTKIPELDHVRILNTHSKGDQTSEDEPSLWVVFNRELVRRLGALLYTIQSLTILIVLKKKLSVQVLDL